MAVRDSRLNALNPLAYIGDNATSPPNIKSYTRAPTTGDCKNVIIGDMWIDESATPNNVYMLTSIAASVATWINLTAALALSGLDGQIMIGVSGGDPVFAYLTSAGGTVTFTTGAGTLNLESGGAVPIQFDGDAGSAVPALGVLNVVGGIGTSVTGAGSTLTINATGGGLAWSEVVALTQAMAVNNGYLANNAAPVVFTLPVTAAQFSFLEVVGKGAGGWKIEQGAGQQIIWDEVDATTAGVAGYLESTDDYDKVRIMCTVADSLWTVVASKGNITVA